ncbi:amidohydrolase family protein [Halopseudomonas sp. SMJS2]|uniref:amidohydrolase family protein n=1 Tax=Halopseudomonas sp. SMJS2 TaxID=3041098 RepID=UPI000449E4B3|nr:amidohydrolase family protein [Halopseudomonas sp. SMJS2]EZQ13932.1 cytosine deaminase [Halopseudomonas bauzanensis]WGK61972.1 amidohydrolase family protein [Halopseudomonas sp. SMJS2]
MIDLLIRSVNLPCGAKNVDIAIDQGKILEIAPHIQAQAKEVLCHPGCLVTAPFVDSHFHMDSTLSLGQPRLNQSGTLLEGITVWNELKPDLTFESIKQRAIELCHWSVARGTLAIRSHVDVSDDSLMAVQALLEVRRELKHLIDLQLVAFPQNGYYRSPTARQNLLRALDLGVDVIGGIPHFERTRAEGNRSITALCELAADRGLPVDLHCDESDDPDSQHIETLAYETQRLGLQGRVTGSHLTSMHSMDNYYVNSKLIPLISEAGLHVVANPLINITLQGRHDTYPKRRGMTRVKELLAAGVNVAFGHDCVMDPWYSLGSHDMLDVAHMGLHVGQLTGIDEMKTAFAAVTTHGAKVLGLDGYGLQPGNRADLVILQASNPIEALRLRPARLEVIRHGQVICRTAAVVPQLLSNEQPRDISFVQDVF